MRSLTPAEMRRIRNFPMETPDLRTREGRSATQYMDAKGYKVRPFGVIKVEGEGCWYFYYDIGDALVELEVDQTDDFDTFTGGFKRTVTAFLNIFEESEPNLQAS